MKNRIEIRYAITSLLISGFLITPLAYIDHRKDRTQFVSVNWLPGNTMIDAMILGLTALLFALMIYLFITKSSTFLERHEGKDPLPLLSITFCRKDILINAALIFLFWIPVLIIMYPCASNHDFINQVYQYQASSPTWYTTLGTIVDAEYIDHHPIFDTLIYGWFISLGDLMGSQNIGMFIFSIIQAILIALALSSSVCYLKKLDLPKCLRLAALAFAVLFPYYSWYSACAMKDMLFVVGFIPFCLCFMEAFRSKGDSLKNTRFLIAFVLVTGLCILTKKLGIYICVASLLVMLIFISHVRIRSLIVLVAPVLVFSLAFPTIVYPAIGGVAPGGKQESICFALQQTTALLIQKPEAISDDDMVIIEKVLDTKAAKENFKEALADGAKNRWRPEATSEDRVNYLKVWAKEGIQNPKIYLLAQLKCSGQLLIPSKQATYHINISDSDHIERWGKEFNAVSEGYHLDLHRPSVLLAISKSLRTFLLRGIGSIPILNLVTTIGLYGGWIPFLCCALAFLKKRWNVLALAPVMWSVCTLLISPGSLGRYVVSIMFVLIPMIGWTIFSQKESDARSSRSNDQLKTDSSF